MQGTSACRCSDLGLFAVRANAICMMQANAMSPQMRLLPSHCGKREDKTLWSQELLSLDSLEVQDLVITGNFWVINVWLSVRLTMLRHLVLQFRGEGLRIWSHDFQLSQTRKIEYRLAPTASMEGFRRMSVLDIQAKPGPSNPAPLPTSPFDWMEVLENLYLKAIFLWAEIRLKLQTIKQVLAVWAAKRILERGA